MRYYQEYTEVLEDVEIKKHGVAQCVSKRISYWAFIAVIDDRIRIKIILKRVGDGNVVFWSVIPYWDTTDYKGIKLTTLYKGSLSED